MVTTDMTVAELLQAYERGQREFNNLSFPENETVQGQDLSGIVFKNSFLFQNFQNTNLADAKFIACNIKGVDFSGANFERGLIKNCAVEGLSLIDANIEGLNFEENYFHGNELTQDDLDWFTKPN